MFFPASEDERAIRIELFDDEVESLYIFDPLTGAKIKELRQVRIFAASHYVTGQDNLKRAIEDIEIELSHRLNELEQAGKLVEKQRLEERTNYDLDMLRNAGFCSGIENYSRHLSGRSPVSNRRRYSSTFQKIGCWSLMRVTSHYLRF